MKELDLKNANILVVDDQQANIDVIHDFLEMQGYSNIVTTLDPRMVVDLLKSFKPDIILLDISMPYLNGFEVMEQLKPIVPENTYLPILILTADISIETKRKALQCGASDFLTKPFDLIELKARVNTHLLIRYKNEQITRYSDDLEKLIATKDKFFSIIAHDLRNPFVGIENFTKILLTLKNYDANEIENQLKMIHTTALQGHELLENLLTWAKSQTGRIILNYDVFLLNEAVENCIALISSNSKNKNITLINTIPTDFLIHSDQTIIEIILRNLLSNAVKFTPESGTVTIKATKKENQIEIAVIDTGVGIPAKDLNALFRIDKNLQSRTGTAGETGSGLGLILSKEFVDKLEGEIWVESELEKGSTFKITLPNEID